MNKISTIIDGWKSLTLGLNTELAKKRAEYCMDCDHARIGIHEAFIGDEIKEIKGLICGKCKCPLSAALRAKDYNCPLKKWEL